MVAPDPIEPDTPGQQLVHQPAEARPSRLQQAGRWASYHRLELFAVALPTVGAVALSWWWLLGTVAVALLWAAHELRVRNRKDGVA